MASTRILTLHMTTNAAEVWIALAWGAVAFAGLLIGAIVGAVFRMSHHTIARAMSIGAGLLLAGVSFKVAASTQPGSGTAIALGNALDGLPEALYWESLCGTVLSRLQFSGACRTRSTLLHVPHVTARPSRADR
jgi:hypothetical protein